jgi:hypothetical protein
MRTRLPDSNILPALRDTWARLPNKRGCFYGVEGVGAQKVNRGVSKAEQVVGGVYNGAFTLEELLRSCCQIECPDSGTCKLHTRPSSILQAVLLPKHLHPGADSSRDCLLRELNEAYDRSRVTDIEMSVKLKWCR